MEETLGKRISSNRKRMGLTQDRLAELLGVTAQAVSKWENDQSCPDIGTIPKLAEIFGITTDQLLGAAPAQPQETEAEKEEAKEDDNTVLEINLSHGRKATLEVAVWLLLAGGIQLLCNYKGWERMGLWETLWTTGLLTFGLFGIYPKFDLFRLCCGLAGGYFLLRPYGMLDDAMVKPVLLVTLGVLLVVKAFCRPRKEPVRIHRGGSSKSRCSYVTSGEGFSSNVSFCERTHLVSLPRLSQGSASVSFGEQNLDLRGCGEIADGCHLDLDCSFGELNVQIPRTCRVVPRVDTSFADFSLKGEPSPDAAVTVYVDGSVSFGEITVSYI